MKILVTGAGGFVGRHLLETLIPKGHKVTAIGVHNSAFLYDMDVAVHVVDITDYDVLLETMQMVSPDVVIHLAAISNVPISWSNPALAAEVNILGSVNVLNALHATSPEGKFIFIGSSDEYGLSAKTGVPLTEDMPCQPQNPYSISKHCAEQMVLQLGRKYGMNVICTRSFNHFGPGQAKGFVVSDFASQVAAIEQGKQEPVISVGDLSAARDFTFVSDIVNAYVIMAETDMLSGIYNICSGKPKKIQEILDDMLSLAKVKIETVVDEAKFRPAEVPFFVGCADKLTQATGWQPVADYKQGLLEVLDYWRNSL